MFDDTKGVTISRESEKDRQYKGVTKSRESEKYKQYKGVTKSHESEKDRQYNGQQDKRMIYKSLHRKLNIE